MLTLVEVFLQGRQLNWSCGHENCRSIHWAFALGLLDLIFHLPDTSAHVSADCETIDQILPGEQADYFRRRKEVPDLVEDDNE
jgi:hypothetical protein